ncbi:uncharacterized protein ARMOST_18097 [Armillaria ostoyae]|uniref:Uncharacterized protein n=1 Tax=Armillaria ostoyae TaxID=47428 RepID=A0A284S0U0_ARMOS|nr:uncharacterized protein ARMOST_18097 [Armillaria ostoyae]
MAVDVRLFVWFISRRVTHPPNIPVVWTRARDGRVHFEHGRFDASSTNCNLFVKWQITPRHRLCSVQHISSSCIAINPSVSVRREDGPTFYDHTRSLRESGLRITIRIPRKRKPCRWNCRRSTFGLISSVPYMLPKLQTWKVSTSWRE